MIVIERKWEARICVNLLDGLGWGVEIDDTLVDAHLETVVGVGTLSVWRLAGHDAESLWSGEEAHENRNRKIGGTLSLAR